MTTAASRFAVAFNQVSKTVEFDRNWSNGTGYFDHAVLGEHAPRLAPGEIVKSFTPTGRKIIIVGTRLNNVVIFQRYDSDPDVIVANYSSNVSALNNIKSGQLDLDSVCNILGEFDVEYNIGKTIEQIFDACKRHIGKVKKPDIASVLKKAYLIDVFKKALTADVIDKACLAADAINYGVHELAELAKLEKWTEADFVSACEEITRMINRKIA